MSRISRIGNYAEVHLHTHDSNTNMIEVVTKIEQYLERAKELDVKGIVVTNHGVTTNWYNNKKKIEGAGFKYVHGLEAYVTWSLDEKVRDNFHLSLYAKNTQGFKELNKLVSKSFNREDGHYYYNPRMTWEEIKNTSDNIIISTACLGGLLSKLDGERYTEVVHFLAENNHRCFLEVQPHMNEDQKKLNANLSKLSKQIGVPLIAGGDVHALNQEHDETRKILQKAKDVVFENDSEFDLTLKGYDERFEMFKQQGVLDDEEIQIALENTCVLIDMVEPIELDYSKKYPKVVDGDSLEIFKQKINEGIKFRNVLALPIEERKVYAQRIQYELETYIANDAVDYMLLEDLVKTYARSQGVDYGYGRGSASGSIIAYLMQITDMNSIERNLNFERFMSKERISLADIDSDYPPSLRHIVQEFVVKQIPNVYCAPIVTANTIAMKGAIKDIGKGLGIPNDTLDFLSKTVEENESELRKEYPLLFKHVDVAIGVITSIGQHSCGICVSPIPLDENMGLITTSDSIFPLTMLNMKEVDAQNYVKLDVLGLDTVQIISETCRLAGIPYLNPNNMDINDEKVWQAIREDNTNIFQYESDFAKSILQDLFSKETIKKIRAVNPNFSHMDLFSLGNAILRPAGASYRNEVIMGNFYDNGHKALNEFLAPTLGRLVYQEQLIQFLVEFCGYTGGHADLIRRGIGKKSQEIMDSEVPKIKGEFVKTMVSKHGATQEEAERIADPFIQVFIDSANYGFSINHSDSYSFLGYACGYLRYYYPLEFLTACLNANKGKEEKINKLIEYTKSKGFEVKNIKYGNSKAEYMFNKEENAIYQGIESIKYLNAKVGDGLYELSKEIDSDSFIDLLVKIYDNTKYKADEFKSHNATLCKACKKLEKEAKKQKKGRCYCSAMTEEELYSKEKCPVCWEIDKEYYDKMVCDDCTVETIVVEGLDWNNVLQLFKDTKSQEILLSHVKGKREIVDWNDKVNIDARQMRILITLNFFSEYGNNKTLLSIFNEFDKRYSAKHKFKTKVERYSELIKFEKTALQENAKLSLSEQIQGELDYLGHIVSKREDMQKNVYAVTSIIKYNKNVKFSAYQFATGQTYEFKAYNNIYNVLGFEVADIIMIQEVDVKPKSIKMGDKWVKSPTEKTLWIKQMKTIKRKEG